MKVTYVNTPMRPCEVCGNTMRFPRNEACVYCTRKGNAVKSAEKLKLITMHIEKPIANRRDRELVKMAGVYYGKH